MSGLHRPSILMHASPLLSQFENHLNYYGNIFLHFTEVLVNRKPSHVNPYSSKLVDSSAGGYSWVTGKCEGVSRYVIINSSSLITYLQWGCGYLTVTGFWLVERMSGLLQEQINEIHAFWCHSLLVALVAKLVLLVKCFLKHTYCSTHVFWSLVY